MKTIRFGSLQIEITGPRFELDVIDRQGLSFYFQGCLIWQRPSIRFSRVQIQQPTENYTDIPF